MFHRFRRAALCTGLLIGSALLQPTVATAKIDLVTIPTKDKTQLSIYKSQDLTLVRETRLLPFNAGENQLQFSWANTQIDPTSLQMRLVKESPNFTVLDSYYPANTQNTIVWNVEAVAAGEAEVEITYFASGLSWKADYTLIADNTESTLRLLPNFTLSNNSGEDFVNAQTRLVVGEVNLVETIQDLARRRGFNDKDSRGIADAAGKLLITQRVTKAEAMSVDSFAYSAAPAPASLRNEIAEIVKQAVSEYYLYTVQGEENLENGWGKQLPNPEINGVEFDLSYEYDPTKYGYSVIKLYKLKNDKEHKMGDVPMPEGTYYVYSTDRAGDLRLEGRTDHKYVPIGEDFELNLGTDGEVIFEERTMQVTRDNFEFETGNSVTGFDVTSQLELEVRNSKDRPVPFKLVRPMEGDWEIKSSSIPFKKVDSAKAEWIFEVPAESKTIINVVLVQRTGSRSRSN